MPQFIPAPQRIEFRLLCKPPENEFVETVRNSVSQITWRVTRKDFYKLCDRLNIKLLVTSRYEKSAAKVPLHGVAEKLRDMGEVSRTINGMQLWCLVKTAINDGLEVYILPGNLPME